MTLGELLPPGGSNDFWDNFNPEQWWYCLLCRKVCQARSLEVFEDGEDGEDTHCPFCECSSHLMFWYHGWPSLVLDGWRPFPQEGDEFHLPRDWEGDNGPEEPGIKAISLPYPAVTER